MACFKPIQAYQSNNRKTINGKNLILFSPDWDCVPIKLPCSQCIGCRLDRSRQWAIRCMHEAKQHGENTFITLTYNDENLPVDESCSLKHWQLFMKKLRHKFPNNKIKFYQCSEYGETYGRPHYHACLFNVGFSDKEVAGHNNNIPYYSSELLASCWTNDKKESLGFSSLGEVTFESAAYVARYILKKLTGDLAEEHYTHVTRYGELVQRIPEATLMSRNPGIASDWFDDNYQDMYPNDKLIIKQGDKYIETNPPRYYDRKYEVIHPEAMEEIKLQRQIKAAKSDRNDLARLAAKEKITQQKLNQLPRNLPE